MQLLLYTSKNSPRLQYIVETLCHAAGIQEYQLTGDIDNYKASWLPKINYSAKPISETECQIIPVDLLFETGNKPQPIKCFDWLGHKAFFKTDGGDVPFDLLAASFYLVSRYEEYLPHQKDEYGRYAHTNSTAFKNGFLQLPIVNLWVQQLCKILLQKFPALQLKPPQPAFVPTYDIDIAWSYFAKGFLRNLGGLVNSLLKRKTNLALERLEVLLGFEEDPFDVYEWLDNLHRTHALHPIYFFYALKKRVGMIKISLRPISIFKCCCENYR